MTAHRNQVRTALALTALLVATAAHADWPQFGGATRQGVTSAEGLARGWAEGGPRELWRRPIGGGFSGISAVGDRLYTMAIEGTDEVVLCLDAADGQVVWQRVVGPTDSELFPDGGPRATPTVSGGVVYAASSGGRLVALAADDGSLVWAKEPQKLGPPPRFGYSVSPLVDGELVIVEAGNPGEPGGVLALDRKSGEVRWSALDGPAGYSSPIAVEIDGVRQYVFFRRVGAELVSLSTDGELLWRHSTKGLAIIVPPIHVPPDRFFVATSDDAFGSVLLRVIAREGGFAVEEAWGQRLMRNHFNASVLVDGHLYGFDNATFRCLDADSGERRWAQRGLGKGSLIAAGDLLYVLGDSGQLVLLEATPEGHLELGRTQAMTGRSWTAPSLASGRLYLRDEDEIVSLDVSANGAGSTKVAAGAAASASASTPEAAPSELTAASAVARHLEARGGAERWREVESLRLRGTYATFSEPAPFTLIRRRGDLYKLDHVLLGEPAVRARDAEGTWGRHKLLKPEAGRIEDGPYKTQFERESIFGPPLVDLQERGIEVELVGSGEIDGRPTVVLALTLPGDVRETWHLDVVTFLEVRVDSTVMDLTQLPQPMEQRTFFSDFREVDGLTIPFQIDLEFGARLESMTVERVEVNPELADAAFDAPPAPAAAGD